MGLVQLIVLVLAKVNSLSIVTGLAFSYDVLRASISGVTQLVFVFWFGIESGFLDRVSLLLNRSLVLRWLVCRDAIGQIGLRSEVGLVDLDLLLSALF